MPVIARFSHFCYYNLFHNLLWNLFNKVSNVCQAYTLSKQLARKLKDCQLDIEYLGKISKFIFMFNSFISRMQYLQMKLNRYFSSTVSQNLTKNNIGLLIETLPKSSYFINQSWFYTNLEGSYCSFGSIIRVILFKLSFHYWKASSYLNLSMLRLTYKKW